MIFVKLKMNALFIYPLANSCLKLWAVDTINIKSGKENVVFLPNNFLVLKLLHLQKSTMKYVIKSVDMV